MARRRRKRSRRRLGGASYGTKRAYVAGAGAAYGYLMKSVAGTQALPYVKTIGRDATNAIVLHLLAKQFRNKWLDYCATAVAGHVGCELGEANFNLEALATMSGGAFEIAGDVDLDDD